MKKQPTTPDVSPDPVAPVAAPAETELTNLQAQVAENLDKYLRATADLENYRKRVRREKDELTGFVREQVIRALLAPLDNLERALAHSQPGTPLHDGLEQVRQQFKRALAEFGLEEIVAHAGDAFDPNLHEAVSHIVSADHPADTIIEQHESGYKLADRLLRPVRVAVSKGPAENAS